MMIYVVDRRDYAPDRFPALTLHLDNWDDFGLKTTFFVTLWKTAKDALELMNVKIMRRGMRTGGPVLPSVNEGALPEDCGSLGADYGFYERVFSLDVDLASLILRSLHDLATDPPRLSSFEKEHAYETSLTRLAPARDALRRVAREGVNGTGKTPSPAAETAVDPAVEADETPENSEQEMVQPVQADAQALRILFTPPLRKDRRFTPEVIDFDFSGPRELPSNVVALVGPNGTGKTTLLAELALAVFFGPVAPSGRPTGAIEVVSGAARDVIFISYSAYDSFEIPQGQELGDDARGDLARQGYVYVGLRKLGLEDQENSRTREHRLKSIQEIDDEFGDTLHRLATIGDGSPAGHRQDREALFASSLRTLLADPSLAAISAIPKRASASEVVRRVRLLFPAMSTGHKAVMNITASLCLHLNHNSLVMMDEPEAHLHPPLVATLLRIIRDLLQEFDAHAIVATHSPIVVQETLGQHVLTFDRKDTATSWIPSPRQTFGENVAALTREVFGLPAALTDFIGVLETLLAADPSLDNLERLFGDRRLSSPARAQALRIIAKLRDGGEG